MHINKGTRNIEKRHDFRGVMYNIYCCSSRIVVRIYGTYFDELHSGIFLKKMSINFFR
jgi:hypothetical protein